MSSDKTIEDLIQDLDDARESYHTAVNERQKMVREKRLYSAMARLSDRCVAAEEWLHRYFTSGKDETWLGVLEKYQKGAKSLEQGARRTLPVPSSLPEPTTSMSRLPNLPNRQVSLRPVSMSGLND